MHTSAEETRRGTRFPPIWINPSEVNNVTLSSETHCIATNRRKGIREKAKLPKTNYT